MDNVIGDGQGGGYLRVATTTTNCAVQRGPLFRAPPNAFAAGLRVGRHYCRTCQRGAAAYVDAAGRHVEPDGIRPQPLSASLRFRTHSRRLMARCMTWPGAQTFPTTAIAATKASTPTNAPKPAHWSCVRRSLWSRTPLGARHRWTLGRCCGFARCG